MQANEEIYVVQHSGLKVEEWHIFESMPHLSMSGAVARKQELEEIHAKVLRFRVETFVSVAAVEAETYRCAKAICEVCRDDAATNGNWHDATCNNPARPCLAIAIRAKPE